MRFSEIHLGRSLMLVTALALVAWGCQAPDLFYREDAGLAHGTGGRGVDEGTGGGIDEGTGGMAMGTGGMIAPGTGGAPRGTGGMIVGTGGMATGTGGARVGTGGRRGTGGSVTGTGGDITTGTGGMVTGAGGSVTGTGGSVVGTGGAAGTNPCAGLCDNPVVFTGPSYNSGSLPVTAVCHETTSNFQGGGVSNYAIATRTLTINSAAAITMDTGFTPPAKRNGGYCFQTSAAGNTAVTYSSFYTF